MRMFLISDNRDTLLGMRLAGVCGVVVHGKNETVEALETALSDENIAVIGITEKASSHCPELINEIRINRKLPLIVEIPDRHGGKSGSLAEFVKNTVGI